jgi:hypothetical protein
MSRQQATNRELGVDTARDNLCVNGGFEIWQRGVGPFAGSVSSADGWMTYDAGPGSTATINRVGPGHDNSRYCMEIATTGTNLKAIYNRCEDQAYNLRGKTLTFAAWVWTNVVNAVRLSPWASPGGNLAFSSFHPGGSVWLRLSVTWTMPVDVTSFHPEIQITGAGTTYVDEVVLVVGSVASDYFPLHPADDLARCQRYYERLSDDADASLQIMAYAGVAGQYGVVVLPFKVTKAVVPTVTLVGNWSTSNCPVPTVASSGKQGTRLQVAATAAGQFYAYNGGTGSTIVAEANP